MTCADSAGRWAARVGSRLWRWHGRSRDLRIACGSEDFAWATSHVFRKTAATGMDRAGLSARQIADQLGHAKISMTQDHYLGRRSVGREPADALDRAHRCVKKGDGAFPPGKRRVTLPGVRATTL